MLCACGRRARDVDRYFMGAQESSRRDDTENSSSGVDYYQLLQVKEDASQDEIKAGSYQHYDCTVLILVYLAIFPTPSFDSSSR